MIANKTGRKLLVADDSLTIQKVIRLALSNEGYEIQTVSDGNDAVQQISVFRPDIVLIDVSLPGKSAFEVKNAINEIRVSQGDLRDTRFVLMSSAFEKVDENRVTEVAFDGRLTKPFDPANLRQVLSDVLVGIGPSVPSSLAPVLEEDEEDLPMDLPSPPPSPEEETLDPLWSDDAEQEEPSMEIELPQEPDFGSGPELDTPEEYQAQEQTDQESGDNDDFDIKNLTESTIKMSGLDDFQWSINETGLRAAPEREPEPEFENEDAPVLPPPPAVRNDRERPSITLPHEELSSSRFRMDDATEKPAAPAAGPVNLDGGELDELIEQRVEEALTRIAREILPEIAERVIKQEIHRMLAERP